MSYVAETIQNLTEADQRAWALMQTGPGLMENRIAEAKELLNWILSESVPSKVSQSSEGLKSASPSQCESFQEQIGSGVVFQEPSGSSSQKVKNCHPELPTPDDTETVAATGDTEEAARTHGGAA